MKKRFYKTGELNSSSCVKIPLRSNALINIENDDKYCFIWSISASFILVKMIILIEFQVIDIILMNKLLMVLILVMALTVVMSTNLKN